MPEAVVLQTKFDKLRDQSFWKGRRGGPQAEGSDGSFGLLPQNGRAAESCRRASDAKNANDIGSQEYLEKVKRIWHVGVARRGHICRLYPYREAARKSVRPSSDRRI